MTRRSSRPRAALALAPLVLATILLGDTGVAHAQGFDSGSDGSDGALSFPAGAGVVDFDPTALGVDADGDNIFHFTTITIPAGTTVKLRASILGEGTPVYWLASGLVQIDGIVDANGAVGHSVNDPAVPTEPGAGGWSGGAGGGATFPPQAGNGPGGGPAGTPGTAGAGGSHASAGSAAGQSSAGETYGSQFVQPLLGGSGGGGGGVSGTAGAGGGGGGGAFLIASSDRIRVDGTIRANGANRNQDFGSGIAGSGGAIRLLAPTIEGAGALRARGGTAGGVFGSGGFGRIRIEAFAYLGPSDSDPLPSVASPGRVFPPANAPTVRVLTVDGQAVSSDPSGSFVTPDATINAAGAITVVIQATNIPPGTVVQLTVRPEAGPGVTVNTTPLAGTLASSTGSAAVTLPSGFTRLFVKASW